MSIEAMNWALEQKTGTPAAKVVLLILANRANDDGHCYPGQKGIAEQADMTRRSVISNVQRLVDAGLICSKSRAGEGSGRKSNVYFLHIAAMCRNCTRGQSEVNAGQSEVNAGQSEADSHEPKENPKKNPQGRATRLPDEFELTEVRRAVAEAERLPADRTFEKFVNYWRSASGAKARKRDWDATWRVWCMSEIDRRGGNAADKRNNDFQSKLDRNRQRARL